MIIQKKLKPQQKKNFSTKKSELDKYIESKDIHLVFSLKSNTSEVLNVWRKNFEIYPSRKFFCVIPTSCYSERCFSTSKLFRSEIRSKMKPKKLKMLTVIKKNL